ncbi:hypothetical protein [Rhizobium cremeum]|uniref:hypothetical protein n=1 Tax=Rhizobium cremeum TaxID=2813827 RepID=UPI0039DF3CAB
MTRWTKSKTFAEELTRLLSSDKASFDATVAIFQEAIDYGRRTERKAALRRLQKTYDAGGFEGGSLTSWGSLEAAIQAVKGEIVHGSED